MEATNVMLFFRAMMRGWSAWCDCAVAVGVAVAMSKRRPFGVTAWRGRRPQVKVLVWSHGKGFLATGFCRAWTRGPTGMQAAYAASEGRCKARGGGVVEV